MPRQRKCSETLAEKVGDDGEEESKKGFFACYLLLSLSPRHKGHTYIGFTVNPRRRIRQHNGEIGCGAFRTKKRRPWEMVLCIHGFPSNVSALQFEWAWQHPNESLAVRKAAASFKSLSGPANKIKLAYTMLTLPSWQSLNLTVNYFSTKYVNHSAGCPSLPGHMKVRVAGMDELPCYVEGSSEDEFDCDIAESCEETSSSSAFGNPEECDKSGFDDGKEDHSEGRGLFELPERPSSPQTCLGSSMNEEEAGLYGFRLKRPTRAPAEVEVEIVDLTSPSPLCGAGLWGKKGQVSGMSELPCYVKGLSNDEFDGDIAKSFEETSSSSAFGNLKECDKSGFDDGRDDRSEGRGLFESPERPSSPKACLGSSVYEEEAGLYGFGLKRPTKAPEEVDVEIVDLTTPSPLCGTGLWGKKGRVCPKIINLTNSPLYV